MPKNKKAERTKQTIQLCFLKLLFDKPIEKITIKELCRFANIHRGTFYRYYTDLYDLTDQLEEELFEKFKQIVSASANASLLEIIHSCIYLIYDEKLVCGPLFKYKNSTDFFHRVTDMSRLYIYEQISFQALTDTEKLYIFNYLCAGVLGLIQTWIHSDFQETPDAVIHYLDLCMSDFIRSSKSQNFIQSPSVNVCPPSRR